MKYILTIKEYLLESTIGSENIRIKHYSDIDKDIFYKIVNLDPTSIRKKNISKPGKYVKWMLIQYEKYINSIHHKYQFLSEDDIKNKQYTDTITRYLFVYSTQWYKNRYKDTDILKFKTLSDFIKTMHDIVIKYKEHTEKAKYEEIYFDNKISILIPINFTASFEVAKNTQWCTKSLQGFDLWNSISILFRIIPKNNLDKLKLTWTKSGQWFIATPKYPEITGENSPFDIIDNEENWSISIKNNDADLYNNKTWKKNSIKIRKTMNLLSPTAKKEITKYYNLNKDKLR